MRLIDANGARLATESFGTPERGAILLVMGATASMLWWPESLCRVLASGGYQVIRFDLRDTGASTTDAPGALTYTVATLADDLTAILDAYGLPAAHFVGMSLGGYLSQIVALAHPERVASLTLIASEPFGMDYVGPGIDPGFLAHFATMADLDWSDRDAVAAFMLRIAELSAGSALPFDRDAASTRIAGELDRARTIQSAFNHALLVQGDLPEASIADATQPILVIHGSEDPVIPVAAGKAIAGAAPHAELVVLDGRGHELAPADLDRIGAVLLDFIDNVPIRAR